jgi:molybdopterin/thiamine biosynthesis adenylyltransferase
MSRKLEGHRHEFREILLAEGAAAGLAAAAPRRARLPNFIAAAPVADAALDGLRLMIVGTGSVGGAVAMHAARLQIKELRLVDPGRFKPESLLTHGIEPGTTGSKALYWGRHCKAISPGTRVLACDGPVERLGVLDFAAADLVVMATDNLAAEVEVGQRCNHLCQPLLQASVYGDMLVAQVRFWRNRDGSGPCPRCGFGGEEEELLNRQTRFRCGGDGPQTPKQDMPPTMSVSFLCASAADLAMMHLLRLVLGLGAAITDGVVEYCGYTHRTTVGPLSRRAECACEHVAWGRVSVARPLHACNLRELAEAALGNGDLPPDLSFLVGDDLLFVEGAACCGAVRPARRFCRPDDTAATCARCGAALRPQTFYSHRPVSAAVLGALIDRPLDRLGAAAPAWVLVRAGDRAVLCQEEGHET